VCCEVLVSWHLAGRKAVATEALARVMRVMRRQGNDQRRTSRLVAATVHSDCHDMIHVSEMDRTRTDDHARLCSASLCFRVNYNIGQMATGDHLDASPALSRAPRAYTVVKSHTKFQPIDAGARSAQVSCGLAKVLWIPGESSSLACLPSCESASLVVRLDEYCSLGTVWLCLITRLRPESICQTPSSLRRQCTADKALQTPSSTKQCSADSMIVIATQKRS
jgi:hypothetical protein